jgi:hypothetical protein
MEGWANLSRDVNDGRSWRKGWKDLYAVPLILGRLLMNETLMHRGNPFENNAMESVSSPSLLMNYQW